MLKNLFTLYSFFIFFGIFAQDEDQFNCHIVDERGAYREHNVDFLTMDLDIEFKPKEKYVIGNVEYTFKPIRKTIDTLFLDAPNIKIDYVWLNKKPMQFSTSESGIHIKFDEKLDWDKTYTLNISYGTNPEKGIYFVGWDDDTDRLKKQIWTQGQGIDNRHWIPSFDGVTDKLISKTNITFEKGYEVISNGLLVNKEDKNDGNTLWQYEMNKPHVPYLIMIAVGKYDYKDMVSKNKIVSRQYFYPDAPEQFEPTYKYSAEMMDWMEEEFGVPYPWRIYRNVPVQDFLYGAMENTTSTILTDYYLQDKRAALERNYIGTNAHELTHQWFGDYITEWSGTHHWLHESFATHYAKHFKRFIFGEDDYQWERWNELRSTQSADTRNSYPIAYSNAGGARFYPKGSLVIDMLRYIVGEEEFKKVIAAFLKNNPYGMVDTHEFYVEFMETLGINLNWFFDQWLYKGGHPHYDVSYQKENDFVTFSVKQIQEQNDLVGVFSMPIFFQLHYTDGSFSEEKILVDKDFQKVVLPIEKGKELLFTLFDPNGNIIKTLTFDKSYEEWMAQAKYAPNMIDRYYALSNAVFEMDVNDKRDDLIEIYNSNNFHAIKSEVVKQLVNDNHKKSQELIRKAINDKDSKVRQAVIRNVEDIPKKLVEDYEKLLTDSSYVTIALTLKKLANQYPRNIENYLEATEGLKGHNNNVYIQWLAIDSEQNAKSLDNLIDLTSKSFEFRTRLSAMRTLKDMGVKDGRYIENLINALINFNYRMGNTAKTYLKELATNDAEKTIIISRLSKIDANDFEQRKINNLLEEIQ